MDALGQITDISNDGLAFTYIAGEGLRKGPLELEIFSTTGNFHLRKVPYKIILDLQIENGFPLSPVTTRRCGMQFGELTQVQKSQLDSFLQNYTVGHA